MSEDLISRQAAIDYINRAIPNWSEDKETALDCLENMPSVQPEITKRTAETEQNVPNGELISRKAAIDAIYEYIENNRRPDFIGNLVWVSGVADAMRIVSELPSVQEQRWIPVTERLPISGEVVIVSCNDDAGDTRYNYTTTGWITPNGEYWVVDEEITYYVTAWMSFPEPYKGVK